MRTIRLYGALGERFGRVWRMDVKSPAEAVRALCSQLKGFRQYLAEHSEPGYRVLCDTVARGERELGLGTAAETIRFVPVVAGSGRGIGQIIAGIAVLAYGYFTGDYASVGAYLTSGSAYVSVGASLMLGGISQALTKPPSVGETMDRPDNKPSYAFDGAVNTAAQGNPVPVCYGEMIVGSQVISAGLSTEQVAA